MINPWALFSFFLFLILTLIFLCEVSYKKKLLSPQIFRAIIHSLVGIGVSVSPFIFESFFQPIFLALVFFSINLFIKSILSLKELSSLFISKSSNMFNLLIGVTFLLSKFKISTAVSIVQLVLYY